MLLKTTIFLVLASSVIGQEYSSSYSLLEKHASFNPDLKTEPVVTHPVFKKETKEDEAHPVFKPEEHARVKIEMVKPGDVKHEMLGDEPSAQSENGEVNRNDILRTPNYQYVPAEVAYPDVPYAPGYGYDNSYQGSNNYDSYENGLTNYYLEPDTTALSFLWSQVPDARAIVGFVGRTIAWILASAFHVFIGAMITVGICTYTNGD